MATAPKKKTTDKEKKRFTTPIFRLSFMQSLFKAQKFQGEQEPREDGKEAQPKYSVTAIWTPAEFGSILDSATEESEKAKWVAIIKEIKRQSMAELKKEWPAGVASDKRGLRDGRAKEGTEGFGEGTRFANLSTYAPPGVVSLKKVKDKKTGEMKFAPITADSGDIYSGCYCRATIGVSAYNYKKMSKGITLWLYNIQKVKDGERLDNRVKAEDDFDDDLDAEWLDDAGDDGDDTGGDDDAGDGDDDIDFDD